MAKEGKVEYKAVTYRLPLDIIARLDKYAEKSGVVRGFAVEQALREYLDKIDAQGFEKEGDAI